MGSDTKTWNYPKTTLFFGLFMIGYYSALVYSRMLTRPETAIYDTIWMCNLALVITGSAMIFRQPLLIGAGVMTVIVDQSLWLADLITYYITGTFPVGVAEYVVWPETTMVELVTTSHHIWFLPASFFVLANNGGFPKHCNLISIFINGGASILALYTSPKELLLENGETFYLNINMAHEFWRDIKFPIYHLCDPPSQPMWIYHIYLNIMGFFTNLPFYGLARLISGTFWEGESEVESEADVSDTDSVVSNATASSKANEKKTN